MNIQGASKVATRAGNELAAIGDLQANAQQSTPALRLLPEILAIIFSFHAEANPPEENGIVPRGMTIAQFRLGWITVTHVCPIWRQVALDHRTLWTYHRFNLGLEWTAELLRRAGDAPLNLTFSDYIVPFPPSVANAAKIISQLLHRVNTLNIGEAACTSAVLDALMQPGPLMNSLTITSGRFAVLPQFLFAGYAPLHHLSLRNALPAWNAVVLTRLKSLNIAMDRHTDTTNHPSYVDLFNALQTMSNLETLMLIGCLPLGRFPDHLEGQKIRIPKLRRLLLSGHVQGFRQMLEHLDFPHETVVRGSCITDDMTGKECCDVVPLLLSYLPRPSLETLDVSWGDRFDRHFNIRGYSTSQEDNKSGKPYFSLEATPCFNIEFQFKFLLWSAEQKLRILKTVYGALPTDELRVLSGKLDLGKDAWPEIFGRHQELRHIRICSLSTLDSLVPVFNRPDVYPNLVSLTVCDMDLHSKQGSRIFLIINILKTCRPPRMSKIFIESCEIRRELVGWMESAIREVEIEWDGVEFPNARRARSLTNSAV
ncbi:hypothetical protein F5148DRAFT_277455 [Russula earlei]|uniref:Uncharacterized protein n=1 Tax=Russula earlei TaxID=71964 RepID=A0ACC0UNE6_9AGAM|nr:hypothetical protein F5148DRAFT_277455 [Russula earlei]